MLLHTVAATTSQSRCNYLVVTHLCAVGDINHLVMAHKCHLSVIYMHAVVLLYHVEVDLFSMRTV